MKAFIKFNKGMFEMPMHWQAWLMLLVLANAITPLFFLRHLEAQVVLGTMLASVTLMTSLTSRFGFTRVLGLGHILWVPMLAFLLARLGQIPPSDAYGIWIRALIVFNSMSLIIDAVEVIRYIAGDRAETVPGL